MPRGTARSLRSVCSGLDAYCQPGPDSQMTSAIHNTRLHQLKQLIQDTIYRHEQPLHQPAAREFIGSEPLPEVEAVLSKLNRWRACRPIQPDDVTVKPLLSKEQLEMDYHEVSQSSIVFTPQCQADVSVCADATPSCDRWSKSGDLLCPSMRSIGCCFLRGMSFAS